MKGKRTLFKFMIASAFAAGVFLIPVNAGAVETEPVAASPAAADPAAAYDGQTMSKGVLIEGTDVSGMTFEEAAKVAEGYAEKFKDVSFTLKVPDGRSVQAKGADLGLLSGDTEVVQRAMRYGKTGNPLERYLAVKRSEAGKTADFPLSLRADYTKVNAYVESIAPSLKTEVKDHDLKRENGKFVFIEGTPGVTVDAAQSATTIVDYIAHSWDGSNASIDLVTTVVQPKGDAEKLKAVKDVLGTYTTNYYGSTVGRRNNIQVGTKNVSGRLMYPGDTLSVSTAMQKRTVENGYMEASAYENGATVDALGGGICQVSTTLYNAVIRAELEVVERSPHSMTVSYVEPSMDAAISDGIKDFVFRNSSDYPIYIEGVAGESSVTFTVFGHETRPANRKVDFESQILETVEPDNVFRANGDLPVGTVSKVSGAHTGYTAQLLKIVTVDGVEQSRTVFNKSKYRATENIYDIATASSRPEATAAMNAAIGSQDLATIQAAAAQWDEAAYQAQQAAQQAAQQQPAAPAEPAAPADPAAPAQ